MKQIGVIHTPFETKFGAPKQGGMIRSDESEILLDKGFSMDSVRGMEEGMFIWVLWEFHQCGGKAKELVRPPKLGGNEKLGVFATRSPFRPNNIAMSLLKLISIREKKGQVALRVQGADMVTRTPVLDIKPYHAKADIPWEENPKAWFEKDAESPMNVEFGEGVKVSEKFKKLIEEVISLDPRPAYHDDPERVYVAALEGQNVHWKVKNETTFEIIKVEKL